MDAIARRYATPAAPPALRTTMKPRQAARPGLICLHPADRGHSVPRLVSFDWGRVVQPLRTR